MTGAKCPGGKCPVTAQTVLFCVNFARLFTGAIDFTIVMQHYTGETCPLMINNEEIKTIADVNSLPLKESFRFIVFIFAYFCRGKKIVHFSKFFLYLPPPTPPSVP